MQLPLSSRVGRLALIEFLLKRALVTPAGISLRLFAVMACEIRDLRLETENDLLLDGLLIERLTAKAREAPSDDRKMCEAPHLFDDGNHLVEDQTHPTVYERLT